MAGQRLTEKTALAANLASADLLMCVDTSDTTSSPQGTSKKVLNKYVIQTDIVDMAASDFHTLATTPVTLVAVPGAGFATIPISCIVYVDYGSTGTSAKLNVYVGHTGTGTYFWGSKSAFMQSITTDTANVMGIGNSVSAISSLDNLAVKIHASGNFHGSVDWTAKVYITYQIIKL
tara:strand:- start:116 stop:643 length:528 start_codon:yes stop_codon:yes gene_type:complete